LIHRANVRLVLFVVGAFLSASLLWVIPSRGSRPTIVQRAIGDREVSVEEYGRGQSVLLLAEGKAVSALASRLSKRSRVIVLPPSFLPQSGQSTLRTALESLELTGRVTIVADAQTMLRVIADQQSIADRMVRFVVLDIDRSAYDTAGVSKLLSSPSMSRMFVLSSPSGPIWTHLRRVQANDRVSVTLIEACGDGLTTHCARELSPLLASLSDGSWPGTGTVLQDPRPSGPPAPRLVVVPNGELQESPSDDASGLRNALVSFSVSLTQRIAVASTETTVADFRRFVEATGYRPEQGCWYHTIQQEWIFDAKASWSTPVFSQTDQHPVTCVTEEDAQAYAAWLSGETGHTYRLPTEVEFDFFNRSGHTGTYVVDINQVTELCGKVNGADLSTGFSYANHCADGFPNTAPVGSFPANDFGLFDTTGNLWELTTDCWHSDYVRAMRNLVGWGPRDSAVHDAASCASRHVIRGGAYLSSPDNLRLVKRSIEGLRSTRVGFRVVRELP